MSEINVQTDLNNTIRQFDRLTKTYEAQAKAVEQLGRKTDTLSGKLAAQEAGIRINVANNDRAAFLRKMDQYSQSIDKLKSEAMSLQKQLADLGNETTTRLMRAKSRINQLQAPKVTRVSAVEKKTIAENLFPAAAIAKASKKAEAEIFAAMDRLTDPKAKLSKTAESRDYAAIVAAEQNKQIAISQIQRDYAAKTSETISALEEKRQKEATKALQAHLLEREKLKIATQAQGLRAAISGKQSDITRTVGSMKDYATGTGKSISIKAEDEAKNTNKLVASERVLQASRSKLASTLQHYRVEMRNVRAETAAFTVDAKNGFSQIIDAQRVAATDLKDSFTTSFSYVRMAFVNQFAGVITRGLYRIIAQAENSIKAARDAEVWAARIQTISQENQLSIQNWRREGMAVSNQFGFTMNDVMAAGYTVISDQITKGADAFKYLDTAAKLARVGVVTLDQSVQALDATLNSYGLSTAYVEQVAASLFKTMELGRLTLDEVSNEVGRFAPIAFQLGITFDEVNAALAAMTIQGMKFQVSSTLIRNIMIKLIKPTKEMDELFKSWGVSTGEGAIAAFGLQGVLQRVFKEVEEGGTRKLGALAGEIRAITGYTALLSDGGKRYAEYLVKLTDAQDSYQNAVEYTMGTTAVHWDKQTEAAKNFLQTNVGDTVLSWFTYANDAGISFTKVLENLLLVAKAFAAYEFTKHVVFPLALSAAAPTLASRAAQEAQVALQVELNSLKTAEATIKEQIALIDAQSLSTGQALVADDIVRLRTLQAQLNTLAGKEVLLDLEQEKQKAILLTEQMRYGLLLKQIAKTALLSGAMAVVAWGIWKVVEAVQAHIDRVNELAKAQKQLDAIYRASLNTRAMDIKQLKELNLRYAEYKRNITAIVLEQKKAVEQTTEDLTKALDERKKQWETAWKAVIDGLKRLSEEAAEQIKKSFDLSRDTAFGPVGGNFDRMYENISGLSDEWKKARQNLIYYVKEQRGLLSGPRSDKWFAENAKQIAALQKLQNKRYDSKRATVLSKLKAERSEAEYVRDKRTTGTDANIQARQLNYVRQWIGQQEMLRKQAYSQAIGPKGVTDEFQLSRGRDISKAILSRLKELKELGFTEPKLQEFEAYQNTIQQGLEQSFRDAREQQAAILDRVYTNAQKDYSDFQDAVSQFKEREPGNPYKSAVIQRMMKDLTVKYKGYADIVKMFERQYTTDTTLQSSLSPIEKALRDGNTTVSTIEEVATSIYTLMQKQDQVKSFDKFLNTLQGIKKSITEARIEAEQAPTGEKARREATSVLSGNKDIDTAISERLAMAIEKGTGTEARDVYNKRVAQIRESQLALSLVKGHGAEAFSNETLIAQIRKKNKNISDTEARDMAIQMRNTLFGSDSVRELLKKIAIGTEFKGSGLTAGGLPTPVLMSSKDITRLIQTGEAGKIPKESLDELAAGIQVVFSKELEALEKVKQPIEEVQQANVMAYVSKTLRAGTAEQNLAWLAQIEDKGATNEDIQKYAELFAQLDAAKKAAEGISGIDLEDRLALNNILRGLGSSVPISAQDIGKQRDFLLRKNQSPEDSTLVNSIIEQILPNLLWQKPKSVFDLLSPSTPSTMPIFQNQDREAPRAIPVAGASVVNVDANLFLDGRKVASVVLPYVNRDVQNNNNTGRTRRDNIGG